jgi:hypothetical protein
MVQKPLINHLYSMGGPKRRIFVLCPKEQSLAAGMGFNASLYARDMANPSLLAWFFPFFFLAVSMPSFSLRYASSLLFDLISFSLLA